MFFLLSGFAYYGEYPLAFAACFGWMDIYDYLIDNGADPNMQDSFGNTSLHMAVIADQPVSSWVKLFCLIPGTKLAQNFREK